MLTPHLKDDLIHAVLEHTVRDVARHVMHGRRLLGLHPWRVRETQAHSADRRMLCWAGMHGLSTCTDQCCEWPFCWACRHSSLSSCTITIVSGHFAGPAYSAGNQQEPHLCFLCLHLATLHKPACAGCKPGARLAGELGYKHAVVQAPCLYALIEQRVARGLYMARFEGACMHARK